MQDLKTPKAPAITDISGLPPSGPILALDPGTVRIGLAVCDPSRTVSRPLERVTRSSWKKLLRAVRDLAADYDAVALVIGLPLGSSGEETPMSLYARDLARKFTLSLSIPVFLQDERMTTWEARGRLWKDGKTLLETSAALDSEAAVVILEDFLSRLPSRPSPGPTPE